MAASENAQPNTLTLHRYECTNDSYSLDLGEGGVTDADADIGW
jgi:hypothetical protein